MTLEPYQIKAVQWLSKRRRGIVVAPAGAGKTILMSAALDAVIGLKERSSIVRIGWMCHTLEQKQQAQAALENFPELAKAASVQIECAAAETDWSGCDVLVVDEVHWAGCQQWSKQVLSCDSARWGMTATPFGNDPERNAFLLSLFDGNLLEIDRLDVANRLVPAIVYMLNDTDSGLESLIDADAERTLRWRRRFWGGEEWELKAQVTWQACIKRGIVGNVARNAKIVELAKHHSTDSVLVLVNEIEHGKELSSRIPASRVCYSGMGKKLRCETLDLFKAGTLGCIVATSLLDEGADLPRANVLIMACGGRSDAKSTQRTGRVLRAFPGKTHGIVYDFHDHQHPMMTRHAQKRIATYRKLGYQINP